MSYLLDTCVVSELRKSVPTVVKKKDLEDWLYGELYSRFRDRILPIDDHVAKEWTYLNASLQKKGHIVGVQDLYIAATAKSQGFSLVTRNIKDFQHTTIPLVNPWE